MINPKSSYSRISAKIKRIIDSFVEPVKQDMAAMEKKLADVALESSRARKTCAETQRSHEKDLSSLKKELHKHFGKVDGNAEALKAEIAGEFKAIAGAMERDRGLAAQTQSALNRNLERIGELLGNLRDFSAKKEADVRRWQEGYDWRILKNFVSGLTFVLQEMQEKVEELEGAGDAHAETLKYFRDYLLEELSNNGVERFGDEFVGEPRPSSSAIAQFFPKDTGDAALDGKVSRVLTYGYRYDDGSENGKVIKNAQLEFFRFKPVPAEERKDAAAEPSADEVPAEKNASEKQ